LYGIEVHAESRRKKDVRTLIQNVMNTADPALHNFAMLDLAALVCTPSAPACDACPVQQYCEYGREQVVE
ncbi:MAG: A/G-specific adenine glycosylase, partial [Chloroflexota bacterium]